MWIIERIGWNQWYDDGGRWIGNREAAREYQSRIDAITQASLLSADNGECEAVKK